MEQILLKQNVLYKISDEFIARTFKYGRINRSRYSGAIV